MHDISEHDSEEEWEGNACEYSRVHLLVTWDTISVNNLLEDTRKLIGLEKSWLGESLDVIWALLHVQTRESLHSYDLSDDLVELEGLWSPSEALRDNTCLLKHVQVVVDCLFS